MKTFLQLLMEVLWLAGAAAFAWFFLKTFVAIELVAGGTTYALWRVEKTWQ